MKPSKLAIALLLPILGSLVACSSKQADQDDSKKVEGLVQPSKPVGQPFANGTVIGRTLSPEELTTLGGVEELVSESYVKKVIATRDSEHWYGFYIAGQKAGYAVLRLRKTKGDEPGGFTTQISMHMEADGDSMEMEESFFFDKTAPYKTIEIRTLDKTSTGSVVRRYVRKGEKTLVETVVDGEAQPNSWAPEMCGSLRAHLGENAPEFSKITTSSYGKTCSFKTDDQEQHISEVRITDMGTRLVSGVKVRVTTLEQKDQDSQIWAQVIIAEDGTALEVFVGEGMSLRLVDKEVAQSNVVGINISSASVKLAEPLGNPEQIKELKLRATFAKGYEPPASTPNQKAEKQADGSYTLTIRSVPGAKVLPEETKDALESGPEVNSNDPEIIALANKITADSGSDSDKVAALNHWVYSNLDKSLSTNLSTASQVLSHKTGDCTEHTVLLLALLRAVNIPARELAGLIYMGGDFSAFGWHAWTEVAIDGRWVQVDPSWDEVIGNATHINLGLEDAMANIGTMTLERL